MIVDKDAALRKRLVDRLMKEEYSIDEASSAEEALMKIKNEGSLPHVIFSEISMTGISGLEFLSKIKKLNEAVEFIIITSYTTAETAVEAVKLGAYDYINKDEFDNIDTVATACNRAVEKIKIRYQNIHLINKLKEQNVLLENKTVELERKREQLDKLNKSIMKSQLAAEQRLKLSNTLYKILEPRGVLQVACDLLLGFNEELSYLFLSLDIDKKTLVGAANAPRDYFKLSQINIKIEESFDSRKMKFFLDHIDTYTEFIEVIKEQYDSTNYICKTITFKQDVAVGVFIIIGQEKTNFSKLTGVNEFLVQITNAYESASMYQRINEMAIKDGLTNLYNHKHFIAELDREIKKARRYKYPVSLLFFDIDDFKSFNDNNGHQVGDQVLIKMAEILKANSRDLDVIAISPKIMVYDSDNKDNEKKDLELFVSRYGGEEFAVILPHTDINGAFIVGERFRVTIEKASFPCQEKQPNGTLTISMGIAQITDKINTSKLLILVADAALYAAKKEGKNNVKVANNDLIDKVLNQGKLDLNPDSALGITSKSRI